MLRRPAPEGHLADALGDLVGLDPDHAVVETAAGRTQVDLAAVVAAKVVEPATPDQLALELVAAQGWRSRETAWSSDGWLLRADGGVTRRANSALALRTPKRPLPEAVAATRAWYAERGLPLTIALPLPARSLLDGGLEEYCGLVGDVATDTHVFAARLDHLLATNAPSDVAVVLGPETSPEWRAVDKPEYAHDEVVTALFARHDDVVFASVYSGDEIVAIGRAVVDAAVPGRHGGTPERWLGITGLAVAPDIRRRGLARAVLRALWQWGVTQGATRSYLQVASGNQAAIRLYLTAGYWHHHDYRYRWDPQDTL